MKFTLSSPVEFKGRTYSEFTFREAETGDLIAADAFEGQTAKVAAILAGMAEVEIGVFKKVKASDFAKIVTEAASLMGESEAPATGA